MHEAKQILVPISPGELFDKITVLQVKVNRIRDDAKLRNIGIELSALQQIAEDGVPKSKEIDALVGELLAVNGDLFDVIERIYAMEAAGKDNDAFVTLARNVYRLNDRRALTKRRINTHLGSRLVEEKAHNIGS